MALLADLNWIFKIVFFTSVLILLFIFELLSIFYSEGKNEKQTTEIIVRKSTENAERFILNNYYHLKNSNKCKNALIISVNADEEQEKICKIFSRFKNIAYIKCNISC